MIELRQFKVSLARRQSIPFDFERASVALLSKHKYRGSNATGMASSREWRAPVVSRVDCMSGQGGTQNG